MKQALMTDFRVFLAMRNYAPTTIKAYVNVLGLYWSFCEQQAKTNPQFTKVLIYKVLNLCSGIAILNLLPDICILLSILYINSIIQLTNYAKNLSNRSNYAHLGR